MRKIYLISAALTLAGCGTIFNGSSQDVSFDSNVKGVEVFVNGVKACNTPCTYPIDRQSGSQVVVGRKNGYEEQQVVLKSSLAPVAIGNLTFVASWLTDLVTGGVWEYRRDGLYFEMKKENASHAENEHFAKQSPVRRYALFNYSALCEEAAAGKYNGEYLSGLAELTGASPQRLSKDILLSSSEVDLAQTLTK